MKIGFDGSRAFLKDRTGTENYSYQLLKALARIDRENDYLVYLRSDLESRIYSSRERSDSRSLFVNSSRLRSNNNYGWPKNFQFRVLNYLRFWTQVGLAKATFTDNLDVLYVPAHTLPLFRKPGLKTVMSVHDLGSEYLPRLHKLKQRLYLGFITKFQLKSATKLIAVSGATKEDLVKKVGIKSKNIKVVYEGVDRSLFKQVRGDLLINRLRQFGLSPGQYFLFVGTIQPRKNLERLIKAFNIFFARGPATRQPRPTSSPSTSLRVRGLDGAPRLVSPLRNIAPSLALAGSKGWMADEIYELPKKLGIEHKVKFLGRVPDKDLPALYSGAIALVFPSLFEGFGLPILEAFACICPVITSNVSSMSEIGGDACLYANPYNIESIAQGMERIMDQDTRNKLIKKGLERVKNFNWEECAKETLSVILSVAKDLKI